jgi:hypothetical protein
MDDPIVNQATPVVPPVVTPPAEPPQDQSIIFNRAFGMGTDKGRKEIATKIQNILGIDIKKIDEFTPEALDSIRGIISAVPAEKKPIIPEIPKPSILPELQEAQKRAFEAEQRAKKLEADATERSSNIERKYKLLNIATQGISDGAIPWNPEKTVEAFFAEHSFGKDGSRDVVNRNGAPVIIDNGNLATVEQAFQKWAVENKWYFKAPVVNSPNLGGIGGVRGGIGANIDWKRVESGDGNYIAAHKKEIDEAVAQIRAQR